MAKSIVGVDIGNGAIRAAEVANPHKPRPTLLRYHEIALPEGAVRGGEVIEINTVATALRQLWSEAKFRSRDVIVGIGGQKVVARDLTVPKLPIERIREALPYQVQELIPVPVGEAILDFYPVADVASDEGQMVSGLLIAAVKDAVNANLAAVRKAGLNPLEVDLVPFALQRALLTEDHGTVAIVEVGAATTNIVLSVAGVPRFVRIIPSGGDDLTALLVNRLDVTPAEAQQLKLSLGLVEGAVDEAQRPAVEAIYDFCRDLLASVRNTLSYVVNTHEGLSVDRILLAGGGTMLPGFARALGEVTALPVEYAEPFTGVEFGKAFSAELAEQTRHRIPVALGLAVGRAA